MKKGSPVYGKPF